MKITPGKAVVIPSRDGNHYGIIKMHVPAEPGKREAVVVKTPGKDLTAINLGMCRDAVNTDERVCCARLEAYNKAVDSLARYKFEMFGYWASKWVSLNRLAEDPHPNPFKDLVKLARMIRDANL